MISDPPSLKLRRGGKWLTEFLAGDTLFVTFIGSFINFLFFLPVVNLSPASSEKEEGPAGRSILPDSELLIAPSLKNSRRFVNPNLSIQKASFNVEG